MPTGGQSKRIDETGNTYGKLKVIGYARTKVTGDCKNGGTRLAIWLCQCDCGATIEVSGKELRRKDNRAVRSCGCSRTIHGHAPNGRQSLTYVSWHSMLNRCTLPTHKEFANYGGRGIKVCDRWLVFDNFLTDMGPRPSKNHTIERSNNNGDYEPSNCKWALQVEQNRNMRTNVWIEIGGRKQVLADWLKELNVHTQTYYARRRRGLSPEQALLG